MRDLEKNICFFERPLFFVSKQKLVWLLKEALNVREEAAHPCSTNAFMRDLGSSKCFYERTLCVLFLSLFFIGCSSKN